MNKLKLRSILLISLLIGGAATLPAQASNEEQALNEEQVAASEETVSAYVEPDVKEYISTLEDSGVIDELDIVAHKVSINGYIYDVSPTVKVEIAGSYGAFTMLEAGMGVVFEAEEYDDGSMMVINIIEDSSVEGF